VLNCLCHACKGYCDITAMSLSDVDIWLKEYQKLSGDGDEK